MSDTPAAERFLSTAHGLADHARRTALRRFRCELDVEWKSDGSPVTRADREVEAMCRERLAALHPEHGVAGEEFAPLRTRADHVWVIDPIDGTLGFVSGFPLWTTLIALLHRGRPVLGLIDAGFTGERWSAVRGSLTQYQVRESEERACRTSACSRLDEARLASTSPDDFDAREAAAFARLRSAAALCRYGGDAYSYALLASGHVDLVAEAGLNAHDYLALVPVIEGAGGVISDWSGQPLGLRGAGDVLAAANAGLHRQALAALAWQRVA